MSHRKLIDGWWERLEAGDLAGVLELCNPDVVCTMPGGLQIVGREQVRGLLQGYVTALPDMSHRIVRFVETGDACAVEIVVSGTMTGPLQTPQGPIPPTGKKVSLAACDVVTVKDGRIATWSAYFDNLDFMTQLGVLPGPGA